MMKKIATSILAAALLGVFSLSACGGGGDGDKCTQAMDKMMNWEMAEQKDKIAKMEGDEKKQAEEQMKAMKGMIDGMKKEVVKKCQEAIKKDDQAKKGLDCVLGAKSKEEAEKCDMGSMK